MQINLKRITEVTGLLSMAVGVPYILDLPSIGFCKRLPFLLSVLDPNFPQAYSCKKRL